MRIGMGYTQPMNLPVCLAALGLPQFDRLPVHLAGTGRNPATLINGTVDDPRSVVTSMAGFERISVLESVVTCIAGFEVTLHGRIWVTLVEAARKLPTSFRGSFPLLSQTRLPYPDDD